MNLSLKKYGADAILLLTLALLTFGPSLDAGFTNWDDQIFITENSKVTNFEIAELFSSTDNHHYMPLSTFSRAIDWAIYKNNALGHHRSNFILHILNTLLVFLIFIRYLPHHRGATLIAVVFLLHPMHTEVVLWLTARTYLLSSFFMLLSWLLFQEFRKDREPSIYLTSIGFFLLALLSSRVVVYFPLILISTLILIDGSDWKKSLRCIAPYFGLSILFGVLALLLNKHQSEADPIGFVQGLLYAAYGIWFQLEKFVWPSGVTAFYPFPVSISGHLPFIYYLAPLLVLLFVSLVVHLGRLNKLWLFSLVIFLSALGLSLKFSFLGAYGGYITADRYSYIPYLGLGLFLVLLINQLSSLLKIKSEHSLTAITIIASLGWAFQTNQQAKIWKNSESLWTDVIEKEPCRTAYNNRGNHYLSIGDISSSLNDFSFAIAIDPEHHKAYVSRAGSFIAQKNFTNAIDDLNAAAALQPENDKIYSNRGNAYFNLGKFQSALRDFKKAIELNPSNAIHYLNRANVYDWLRKSSEALADYDKVLELEPDNISALSLSTLDLLDLKQAPQALIRINKAIRLAPNNGEVYLYRSYCYSETGDFGRALEDARKASSLGYPVEQSYINQLNNALQP